MAIKELNKLYEEHRKEYDNTNCGEFVTADKANLIEEALLKDVNLAFECFSSCSLDFFLWFNKDIDMISRIVFKYRNIKLLEVLEKHISIFNDSEANEYLESILKAKANDHKKWN